MKIQQQQIIEQDMKEKIEQGVKEQIRKMITKLKHIKGQM